MSAREENRWLWDKLWQAGNRLWWGIPSDQDQGRFQQVEQARNEALAEAQFLRQAPEEKRNAIERAWAYNFRVMETREAMILKGQLRTVENTIERLKKDVEISDQEAKMLQSKLSLMEAHLGGVDTRLWQVEWKAYGRGFEECKVLAVQILSLAEASLFRIPIPAISHALDILRPGQGRGRGWGCW